MSSGQPSSSGIDDDELSSLSSESGLSSSSPLRNKLDKLYNHFAHGVYYVMVHERDSYDQRMKKLLCTALFLATALLVPLPFFYTTMVAMDGSAGTTVMLIDVVLVFPVYIVSYFVARQRKHVSDSHISILLSCSLVLLIVSGLTSKRIPVRLLIGVMQMCAAMVNPSHLLSLMILGGTMQMISAYNEAADLVPGMFKLLLPLEHDAQPLEVGATAAVSCWCVWLVAMVVNVQFKISQRAVDEAQAAVVMTNEVVQLFRKYDTVGVKDLLKRTKGVDPKLVANFIALTENLDEYRPFLPNYMFYEEQSVGTRSLLEDSGTSRFSGSGQLPAVLPVGLEALEEECGTGDSAPSIALDIVLTSQPVLNPLNAYAGAANRAVAAAYGGNVAFALLDISGFPANGTDSTTFVDALSVVAASTQASIHSMIGDTVQLTWNATHRTAHPEMRAARTLCRLAKIASSLHRSFAGAIFTGSALCTTIRTSNSQRNLLIHSDWLPALHSLFKFAQQHATVVCDGTTHAAASLVIDAFGADVLYYNLSGATTGPSSIAEAPAFLTERLIAGLAGAPSLFDVNSTSQRSVPVFELLGEKRCPEDDEALYSDNELGYSQGSDRDEYRYVGPMNAIELRKVMRRRVRRRPFTGEEVLEHVRRGDYVRALSCMQVVGQHIAEGESSAFDIAQAPSAGGMAADPQDSRRPSALYASLEPKTLKRLRTACELRAAQPLK